MLEYINIVDTVINKEPVGNSEKTIIVFDYFWPNIMGTTMPFDKFQVHHFTLEEFEKFKHSFVS